ncbi:hypothetical protein OA88_11615 [Flavobacterium sp. JRM]|nr:hypothetical protein OA88_11615 [Flavobacterium sp. JRM]
MSRRLNRLNATFVKVLNFDKDLLEITNLNDLLLSFLRRFFLRKKDKIVVKNLAGIKKPLVNTNGFSFF